MPYRRDHVNTLQRTATHCNTLQHKLQCNALQHTATHCNRIIDALPTRRHQHTATHCNTLQHTTTHNTLQRTATHCNGIIDAKPTRHYLISLEIDVAFFRTLISVLYNIAFFYRCLTDETISTHCNALQHTTTHYSRIIDALPTRLYLIWR